MNSEDHIEMLLKDTRDNATRVMPVNPADRLRVLKDAINGEMDFEIGSLNSYIHRLIVECDPDVFGDLSFTSAHLYVWLPDEERTLFILRYGPIKEPIL